MSAGDTICGQCGVVLVPAEPRAGGGDLFEPHECPAYPRCTCGRIRIGREVTEDRNWDPDCVLHGLRSAWWHSPENAARRKRANRKLRAMQRLARIKRRAW